MWSKLEKILMDTKDPRILGDGDYFENIEYVNETKHSWAAYEKGEWEPQKH